MFYRKTTHLFLLTLLQVLSFAAISTVNAEPDSTIEFDYVNSFKGYTTTVSIDDSGTARVDSIRTTGSKGDSHKTLKLNQKQSDRLQTLLSNIDPLSLEAEYGLGSVATDEPSYRFRFRNDKTWKETRIDPYRAAPKPPEPLLVLEKFMMSLIFPK